MTKYASFKKTVGIPYLIIEKLASCETQDAENIWKLLKYTDINVLSRDNLTLEEKMSLIWKPNTEDSTIQGKYNIFLKPLISSSLSTDESQTQLRINKYKTTPISQIESVLLYSFDLVVDDLTSMVYDENNRLVEKTLLLEALILDTLQMLDFGVGVNYLRFDRMSGGNCESILNISNSKSLYGRSFLLALRFMDTSMGGGCIG